MPELPEVETVVRGLRATLTGVGIAAARWLRPDIVRTGAELADALAGCRIAGVHRAGKYIVIELQERAAPPEGPGSAASGARLQWMIHLGMTGSLRLYPAAAPCDPHTHAAVRLADGRELRFRDPRRFGGMAFAPAPRTGLAAALRVAAGREPLEIAAPDFVRLFRGRRAPIKNLLLNQRLLRGVGNIYADESLHRAGIHPRARALSAPRLRRLRRALRRVLGEAIAAGGSSVSDYVASDGARGLFQVRHRVYGRAGRRCRGCGATIRRIVLAGRGAHFCPACQRR